MNEYVFEVRLRAVVRVRASEEGVARKVVPSVLGAPGSVEINLANENNAWLGQRATVTEVDFMHETGPRLLKDDVAHGRKLARRGLRPVEARSEGCGRATPVIRDPATLK
jgi:hypothetical protein